MDIKFKELQKVQGESAKGVWTAYKIVGLKLEDGSPWESSNIFDNQYNSDLLAELKNLEAGEQYAIKHKKNAQGYWAVTGIGEVEDKPRPSKPTSGRGGSSGSSSKKSNGDTMSKEEWAEKNRVDATRIAKSVALKIANENTKTGTKPATLIEMAAPLVPWLLEVNDVDDVPFDMGGEDGLDAPDIE